MSFQQFQVLRNQEDCDASASEVLLVADAAVARNEQPKQGLFRRADKITVVQVRPAHSVSGRHFMARQKIADLARGAMVQENLQANAGCAVSLLSCAKKLRTIETCPTLTPSNWSRNASTVKPRPKLDSNDSTGTRVP